jgi:DNA-binding transcriptional MerR regulator
MEMRVEQLSVQSGVAVDTIRYYQSKGLLEPPRREGRLAWYDQGHLERLARVRSLQQRGFTLATIVRLIEGDLDAADEALIGELSGGRGPDAAAATGTSGPVAQDVPAGTVGLTGSTPVEPSLTLAELATETGVPLALLKAIEAEGLLIPKRFGDENRYTAEDVGASRAGLLLLEWGIPLSSLLEVARRHHEATEAVAREAVAMFAAHIRGPLHQGRDPRATGSAARPAVGHGDARGGDAEIGELLLAYEQLLPAVTTLVGHHFARVLVKAALDHVEQVGSDAERKAIWDQAGLTASLADGEPDPSAADRLRSDQASVSPA